MLNVEDHQRLKNPSALLRELADKPIGHAHFKDVLVYPQATQQEEVEDYVVRSLAGDLHTQNYLGYLKKGSDSVRITSRFFKAENQSDYFLYYLLGKVIGTDILQEATIQSRLDERLDLAHLLFQSYLSRALRKGLYKRYVKRKYNDLNFRGKLDEKEYLKRNIPFHGKISYVKRELSVDVQLMQLIRHTIEFLAEQGYGKLLSMHESVRQDVREIKGLTPDYRREDRPYIIQYNQENPIIHAYYSEYQTLQRLCLNLLNGFQTELKTDELNGVLINVAWLWEAYLEEVLGHAYIYPDSRKQINKQYYFNQGSDLAGKIYPDMISKQSNPRIVLDAKYKRIEREQTSDYHQILAYMFRFDAQVGYLIYPSKQKDRGDFLEEEVLTLRKGLDFSGERNERSPEICVKRIGLIIKETDTYDEFVQAMEAVENQLRQAIIT